MNRETIEANDQRLTSHVRTLVARNANKAPVTSSNRPVILAGVMVLLVAFSAVGYIAWSNRAALSDAPITEANALPDPQPVSPDVTTRPPVEPETVEEQPTESPDPSFAIEDTEPEVAVTDMAPVEPATTPPLTITELVTCSQVINRQFSRITSVFSLKDTIKPVVWMTVRTEDLPRTLTHVYYINGEKYCEVPLSIRFPRTRTWSHVTINTEKHLGPWLVDVVDENGVVLDQVEFEVVP